MDREFLTIVRVHYMVLRIRFFDTLMFIFDFHTPYYYHRLPFPLFRREAVRIARKMHANRVPKMLYYKEYFQIPSPDKGKWKRFFF